MRLYDLLDKNEAAGFEDAEITLVTDDSRRVVKDCIFVCVKGNSFDGHSFASKASEIGAALIVADHDLGLKNQLVVPDTRKFYGGLCAAWFDHPERKMKLIGITGTNGKTTMTTLIKEILTKNGHKVGLIGTIQNEIGDEVIPTENTTPMAFDFMRILALMASKGCEYVVMEVSSFAIEQNRIGPSEFEVGVFTNLTQDHLDYHKTMENYYLAKKKMFSSCKKAVINTKDGYGKRLFDEIYCEKYSYGSSGNENFTASEIKLNSSGACYDFINGGEKYPVKISLPGKFNVDNSVAAAAVCILLGIEKEKALNYLSECKGVKGRCEVIPTGKEFTVICDYAHTPDAIENVLSAVKEYTKGRLICLFGCGGNRDAKKRPLMAAAAAKYADLLVITSDNPRDEDPEEIIREVSEGIKDNPIKREIVTDRKEAIFHALKIALPGDVILLAGKGHEDYQVLKNNEHIHFDEREIVREGLELL